MLASSILLLGGCETYRPEPLEPIAAVDRVAAVRVATPLTADAVTLADALGWLREHGPELREAIAAWRTAHERAAVATPWSDPVLTLGPQLGFGSVAAGRELTGIAGLALAIPLGDRRAAADALDRARAETLRIDALLTARSLHLDLRGHLARLALGRTRREQLAGFATDAARGLDILRRAVELGRGTALDLALVELETARAEAAVLEVDASLQDEEATLARLTGVAATRFAHLAPSLAPSLPDAIPDAAALRAALVRSHPELVRRRCDHELAERRLRLEIERQYPDLTLGPTYQPDPGSDIDVVTIGVGLQIPLFARNRKEIAAARAARAEARERYDTAASRALAELDAALAAIERTRSRSRTFAERILPVAERHAELAQRAVAAGEADALRALEIQRSARLLRAEALQARLDELDAWLRLERAVGQRFVDLGDGGVDEMTPPAPLRESSDAEVERRALGPFDASDGTAHEGHDREPAAAGAQEDER